MTTDKPKQSSFIKDMGAVFTPVFYIFAFVAIASALIVQGFTMQAAVTSVFLMLLAGAAAADVEKGIVPDMICCLIAVVAIVQIIIKKEYSINALMLHLAGALCLSLPMLICAMFIKGGFGGGDIKFIAAGGLLLALDKTLVAGVIAFSLTGLYSLFLMVKYGNKGLGKTKIKLAPFLAIGMGFSLLFGDIFLLLLRLLIRTQ